jgi:hypothetical protein
LDLVLTANSIVVASLDQVSCELGQEAAILNLSTSVYYGLDSVGARVWRLLQKPHRVTDLREALVTEYDVDPVQCEQDLIVLLGRMREEGLIEVKQD